MCNWLQVQLSCPDHIPLQARPTKSAKMDGVTVVSSSEPLNAQRSSLFQIVCTGVKVDMAADRVSICDSTRTRAVLYMDRQEH